MENADIESKLISDELLRLSTLDTFRTVAFRVKGIDPGEYGGGHELQAICFEFLEESNSKDFMGLTDADLDEGPGIWYRLNDDLTTFMQEFSFKS
jgi:hypothetical protein